MPTIKIKGTAARNIIADRMVDQLGEEGAMNRVAPGSPMARAVREAVEAKNAARSPRGPLGTKLCVSCGCPATPHDKPSCHC